MAKWFQTNDARYRKFIHSRKWRELRKLKLEQTIWCEDCAEQSRRELATEVHHITPILSTDQPSQMSDLAYDYNNLRALCHRCHCRRHSKTWKDRKAEAKHSADVSHKSFVAKFFG
ncbi:MAG: HNH endonuclease [Alistipes sp.]|nr:HNH endonuclease [Alistipes sp.]